jgi:DNA-binding transcriptional MocR family regulator
MAAPLMAELACGWLDDGTEEQSAQAKRREAAERQRLARERLAVGATPSHAASAHLWLELPPPWTPAELALRAGERGVSLTPAESFVAGRGPAPRAVRLCLSTPPRRADLERALGILAELLGAPPGSGRPLV